MGRKRIVEEGDWYMLVDGKCRGPGIDKNSGKGKVFTNFLGNVGR